MAIVTLRLKPILYVNQLQIIPRFQIIPYGLVNKLML